MCVRGEEVCVRGEEVCVRGGEVLPGLGGISLRGEGSGTSGAIPDSI